ncbi:hypothetical protein Pyn_13123 [Prunus yedoensis var. nudiflora]|uniref:Uncharacterized protein n=1 Tax=Prunus yedoensis var. nudiflora TaxID=2094558 RepID=A0A314XGX1_PRUYE|nr:hypothetical protein Pyn_13123 [Prunus yedoensis var. nudiflora]
MTTVNVCSDHDLTVTDIVVHNLYDSKYVGGVAVRTQNEKWQGRIGDMVAGSCILRARASVNM